MKSNSLKKPEKSLPFHWYYDPKIFQKEIDKINFEQGSAVFFPSNKLHSSTNPYNNKRRIVINITMKTKEIK